MNEREQGLNIQRILVALDASSASLAALEAAVNVAARFDAELLGLFVEDVDLLSTAESPFVSEICLVSATRREIKPREVERQLRVRARRVRQRFTLIAQRTQIRCTFRVERGRVTNELLKAASEADLVVLGRTGWSLIRRRGLGSTAREVVSQTPGPVLLLQPEARLGAPILVVYDSSDPARRAISAAVELIDQGPGGLTILLLIDGRDEEQIEEMKDEVREQLGHHRFSVRYRTLTESTASRLALLVKTEERGTLVLPVGGERLKDEAILSLLEESEVPVLLMR